MKSPAFQFYVRDWLLSRAVQKMSGDQVKAYLFLLCESWLEEGDLRATVPNNDEDLAVMAKLPLEKWLAIKGLVISQFIPSGNRLVNLKLKSISDNQRSFAKNGLHGGNPNFEKGKPNPYYLNQKDNQKDNQSYLEKDNQKITSATATATASATATSTNSNGGGYSEDFESFWMEYPKKVGKGGAWAIWKKLNPSKELLSKMVVATRFQKKSDQWVKDGGQFIPDPERWLKRRRWEDGVVENLSKAPRSASDYLKSLNQEGA